MEGKGREGAGSGLTLLPQTSRTTLVESPNFGRRCDGRALADVQRSKSLVKVGCRGLAEREAPMPWLSHASSHLMFLQCFCGTLTLLSGIKYHSSCAYSYQGTQIPLQQGCTRVCSWILLLLWQKLLWSMNIETISKRLAVARMQTQKFPGGSCRQLGSPSMQAIGCPCVWGDHHRQHNLIPSHHTPPCTPWALSQQN